MPGLTILRVVNNEEIERAEREQIDRDVAARQQDPLILGLAAHIRTCWEAARIAREPITNLMLKAMRQRNGEYEADKLTAIRNQGWSEAFNEFITDLVTFPCAFVKGPINRAHFEQVLATMGLQTIQVDLP